MPVKELAYRVLPADAGRVDALVARLVGFSRARVRGLIEHGGVRLGGQPCADAGLRVEAGAELLIRFDPERRYKEKPAARATRGFTLVFADEHLVVVAKEAGLLTVPTDHGESQTLIALVSAHLNRGQRGRPVSVVHRLDRDTSGLLVFGRRPEVAKALSDQFAARKPEREYAAIVAGVVAKDEGEIRSHLRTDKALNQRSAVEGELAVTHFAVAARFADATAVRVRLETGRRNQIRVHFAEMGHPVLGDTRYEPAKALHHAWPYARLALHARVLGFMHPVERRPMRFEAPLPREMRDFGGRAP